VHTRNETVVHAPLRHCLQHAADVERWPDILPHYRWVRFHRRDGFARGRVEMAARRWFGPLPWPVWWLSEMSLDEERPAVLYTHVGGITTGMEVVWGFEQLDAQRTRVWITHDWEEGPRWPLPRILRRLIGRMVVGPVFIHHVAGRTLRFVRAAAERDAASELAA
jgi:hypothetical protein